jgi:glycosyltransferase involved in cell wall biosynthesis
MKVSVVIPTYGRPAQVAAAAASALRQALPRGWSREVIVVDDGGKDATAAALKKFRGLRYAWKGHAGPAAARNFGARLAQGEIIAFLDSDTLAQAGWLKAGLARLKRDKALFAVEGKVSADRETELTPFTEKVENPSGGRWLSCNLFVRREDFLKLGGFDERFKQPIREDSEFAFRAMEAGKKIAFEPKALVLHPVREVGPGRFFYHAQEGKYEALLRRGHPESYRKHFKWLDGREIPAYYWAHYAALPLAFVNWRAAGILLAGGSAALLYAWCRRRRAGASTLAKLAPLSLLIPYFRLFWVGRGYLSYPGSPER